MIKIDRKYKLLSNFYYYYFYPRAAREHKAGFDYAFGPPSPFRAAVLTVARQLGIPGWAPYLLHSPHITGT